ncbi:MAG TPA: hypothetical protein VM183_04055 [Burkholderiales bacterium]|nr:hypothetical protein [Burkholderiales bacterium]
MDFPRYRPKNTRLPGASAFSDYVAAIEQHDASELKSCRVNRQLRKKTASTPSDRPHEETDPVE